MFQQLLEWSRKYYAHLPWRRKRSMYKTLVSEIMLQQTSVATVSKHFDPFLKTFPNLASLASATENQVLLAWQGLGYYKRAKNLWRAAITLKKLHGGSFPKDSKTLRGIPGIGLYTSEALIAIGANQRALGVDANLERVLARIFALKEKKGPQLQAKIRQLFEEKKILRDLESCGPRHLHEALMDLGRAHCTAKRADCILCPVRKHCLALRTEKGPLAFPVLPKRKEGIPQKNLHLILLRLLVKRGNKILGYVKGRGEWLEGQIEVPTFVLDSADANFKQYPFYQGTKVFKNLPSLETSITKYKIENKILQTSKKEAHKLKFLLNTTKYRYFSLERGNHFSTATRKIIKCSLGP